MRFLVASLGLAFLVGCGAKQPKSGWEYHPPANQSAASLDYRFNDGEGTVFIGSCEGEPSFIMAGGAWKLGAPQFTLSVDGSVWTLPTSQGEHGHYLPVELQASRHAIANARQRIVFQVGGWRREMRPGGPLRSFVKDCS